MLVLQLSLPQQPLGSLSQWLGAGWTAASTQGGAHEAQQNLDLGDPRGTGMAKPCWTSSWQPTSRALALCAKTLTYRQQQWFGLIKLGTEVKLGQ